MNEFNKYLTEAIRVRRTIQVYSEIFDSRDAIDTLSEKSIEFTSILKRSMHDEILISLARLFDTDGYDTKNGKLEYLSQRNLILANESLLNEELIGIRNKTTEIWALVKIKNYRDFKLAHNDKEQLLGSKKAAKHNVSFESAVELVETSIRLILGLMAASGHSSINSNLNEKYEGVGAKFIASIQ